MAEIIKIKANRLFILTFIFSPLIKYNESQFYERIKLETQENYNRVINEDTLSWWSQQDKQIQEDAFGEGDDRIELQDAMKKL